MSAIESTVASFRITADVDRSQFLAVVAQGLGRFDAPLLVYGRASELGITSARLVRFCTNLYF